MGYAEVVVHGMLPRPWAPATVLRYEIHAGAMHKVALDVDHVHWCPSVNRNLLLPDIPRQGQHSK